jgi:hypothetical protein
VDRAMVNSRRPSGAIAHEPLMKALLVAFAVALLAGCPRAPGPACYTVNGIPSEGGPRPTPHAKPAS